MKNVKKFIKLNYKLYIYIVMILLLILNVYLMSKLNSQQINTFYVYNIEIHSDVNNGLMNTVHYESNKSFMHNFFLQSNSLYVPSNFIKCNFYNVKILDNSFNSSSVISMLELKNELISPYKDNYIIVLENIVSLLENSY